MRRLKLLLTFSLLPLFPALLATAGQSPTPPVVPSKHVEIKNGPPAAKGLDTTRMTPQQRSAYMAARRATDWLRRTSKPDGKFVYGFLPDLRAPLEGDSFVAQAGAAFA